MHQTLATALKIEDSSSGTFATNAAIRLTPFSCESTMNSKTEYCYSFCRLTECFVFSCDILFNSPLITEWQTITLNRETSTNDDVLTANQQCINNDHHIKK